MFRANVLTILGRAEEGRDEIERGLRVAHAEGDVESLGWAHMNAVNIAALSGETESAVAHGLQGVEIAERLGDAFSRAIAPTFLGIAHVSRREYSEAIPHLERSQEIIRERHTALEFYPWTLCYLAEALAGAGDVERGRETADLVLRLATERAQWPMESQARVVLAKVMLASDGAAAGDEIEDLLHEAITIAERLGAAALALMGRMGLVRLAAARGDASGHRRAVDEARTLAENVGATGHARELAAEHAAGVS